MKELLQKVWKYLMIYELGVLVGLLVYMLALYPVLLIFELSEVAENFVRAALNIIGAAAGMFVFAYRKGQKNIEWNRKDMLIPLIIVFGLQQIIAPILQYMVYFVGSTKELSIGISILAGLEEKAPFWMLHLCMVCYDILLFIPAIYFGEYYGTQKRIKERTELMGSSKT